LHRIGSSAFLIAVILLWVFFLRADSSFPIRGGTAGVYHNHIWLPPEVAAFCNARGIRSVQLKYIFHLRDVTGYEVTVPAVLTVLIGQTP
jgi:hypothetical protein